MKWPKVRLGIRTLNYKARLGVRAPNHKVRVRVRVGLGYITVGFIMTYRYTIVYTIPQQSDAFKYIEL